MLTFRLFSVLLAQEEKMHPDTLYSTTDALYAGALVAASVVVWLLVMYMDTKGLLMCGLGAKADPPAKSVKKRLDEKRSERQIIEKQSWRLHGEIVTLETELGEGDAYR